MAYAHGPIRFKSNLLTLLCSINSSHPAPTPRPALQLECVCNQVDQLDTPPGDEAGDQVNAEAQAWAALPEAEVALHRNGLGLVVEFALTSRLKKKFPLHYIVFRQSPSHLSHEGNAERVFFGAKISVRVDAKMRSSVSRLATKIGVNKKRFKPTVAAIWARYQEKHKGLPTYQNSDND